MAFECSKCGKTYSKWQGKCTQCGEWNSIVEIKNKGVSNKKLTTYSLSSLLKKSSVGQRITSGIKGLDSLLGGGFAAAQTILLAGEPGIGKSTLALQIAAATGLPTFYASGEETEHQLADRASRVLGMTKNITIAYESDVDAICQHLKANQPKLAIIDSIQTMTTSEASGTAGSLSQTKECTSRLISTAKKAKTVLVLIGQITKSGSIAGPKTLEHMVDTVIYIEGERTSDLRIIKCKKNRFGKTNVSTVFKMAKTGLLEVRDPSSVFLSANTSPQVGVARSVIIEGQLPIGIEIQALTAHSAFSFPKRVANGISLNKLYLLIGVIEKYTKVNFRENDVYLNLAGGLTTKEPGVDLALAAALISSQLAKPISPDTFFIGELELSGAVRPGREQTIRIKTAIKCGAGKIISNQAAEGTKLSKTLKSINSIHELPPLIHTR